MATPKVEDYLKAIYEFQGYDKLVAPSVVATKMGVKPPTVTSMLQRMDDEGLVEYECYQGARLTESGEKEALKVLRHHRLLELFLTEKLGYDWSEVHDEADELEHYISEKLGNRMEEILEFPLVDPHGEPIPTADLEIRRKETHHPLPACKQGDVAIISEVRHSKPDILTYLTNVGATLSTVFEVTDVAPFGMVTIEVKATSQTLSLPTEVAANIYVSQTSEGTTIESKRLKEMI
ncbi:metal-dependent transcriptional regulator [Halogranum rubrum]|uniref:HTH dtxR-type domain-containing protein n=1 Tax=Halogranum salarium B-1 TaxID=1210908 RepID=J3JCX2_9EURY|nr:metal-dependent transcriptional regulator [Halogranum salarium]EJN56984.1 hypothetical protein HSB1_48010 [Halogranum salarium B-1]